MRVPCFCSVGGDGGGGAGGGTGGSAGGGYGVMFHCHANTAPTTLFNDGEVPARDRWRRSEGWYRQLGA